jgi:hypothetical protein
MKYGKMKPEMTKGKKPMGKAAMPKAKGKGSKKAC